MANPAFHPFAEEVLFNHEDKEWHHTFQRSETGTITFQRLSQPPVHGNVKVADRDILFPNGLRVLVDMAVLVLYRAYVGNANSLFLREILATLVSSDTRTREGWTSDLKTAMTGFGRTAVGNLESIIDFITPYSSWKSPDVTNSPTTTATSSLPEPVRSPSPGPPPTATATTNASSLSDVLSNPPSLKRRHEQSSTSTADEPWCPIKRHVPASAVPRATHPPPPKPFIPPKLPIPALNNVNRVTGIKAVNKSPRPNPVKPVTKSPQKIISPSVARKSAPSCRLTKQVTVHLSKEALKTLVETRNDDDYPLHPCSPILSPTTTSHSTMSTAAELSTSSTRLTGKPDGVTDTRVAASEDLNGTLNTTTTTANAVEAFITEMEDKRRQEMVRFREFTTTLQQGKEQVEQSLKTTQSQLKETELKLEESDGAITLFRHQMEKLSVEKSTAENKVKDLEREMEGMRKRVAEMEESLKKNEKKSEAERVETQVKLEAVRQGLRQSLEVIETNRSM